VFRSFAKAPIAADVPDRTGNTHPIMIRTAKRDAGGTALGCVITVAGRLLPRKRSPGTTPQKRRQDAVVAPDAELPTPGFKALIERTGTETLVELLRIKLGFPREVFERAVSPVIKGYAQFVQLLPVGESRQHANPDDLFARALDVASRALDYRRGQILPRGAAPEVIGAQAYRWTYAVFVAALLCGVGKNRFGPPESPALQSLDRFVPPSVLQWLAEDPALMRELLAFLSAADWAPGGAISELVLRAATESGSRDRLPHTRGDPTAKEVAPMIDPRDVEADARIASAATNESTLFGQETEYLDDVDHEDRASDQESLAADPMFAQASEVARRFIGWLQQGLFDGTLRVNQAGALVHCVDEGMLLVSPRIFREFARRFGEDGASGPVNAPGERDIGKFIQRQFLRAGLHLRVEKGVNILTYQVMRGDRAVSRLSGVVIRDPARFVNPVPPINPLLVRLREGHADA